MKIATKNLEQTHFDSVRATLDLKPYTTIELMLNLIKSDRYKSEIEKIRSLTKEQAKPYKQQLPAFFAVDFDNTSAVIDDVISNTGIMIFDVDIYDLEDSVLHKISSLAQTAFCFRSPSNGIKFGIQTNYTCTDNELHKAVYSAVAKVLERKGIVCEVDRQTSNINRMCYLSHDKTAYYNPKPDTLNVSKIVDKASIEIQEKAEQAKQYLAALPKKTRYQERMTEIAEQKFLHMIAPRNRDKTIYIYAMELFRCGLTQIEVEYKLTEHSHLMGDHKHNIKHKTECAFKAWQKDGCSIYEPRFKSIDLTKIQ